MFTQSSAKVEKSRLATLSLNYRVAYIQAEKAGRKNLARLNIQRIKQVDFRLNAIKG
jgi:hypothetical protein